MADRIIGQPSNLTVVTAGAGGNVRVTYDPWELDWEFFDAIAIGHWLANTTTAVSDDIVAKGGSEHLGYWFEISTAFPDANWNTGNRITPQRQAAINQYATFALAVAAMAVHDVFLAWYGTATNKRVWEDGPAFVGTAGSVWGMLSRNQIHLKGAAGAAIGYSGNLLGQINQVSVRNLTVWSGVYSINYSSGAGQEGFGIRLARLFLPRGQVVIGNRQLAGSHQIDNCFAMGREAGTYSFYLPGPNTCLLYNNVAIGSNIGFWLANRAHTVTNCAASECDTCYLQGAAATIRYCADTDGTLPVHATNLRNQDARTQLRFFYDLASPGRKKFAYGGRIHLDSVLSAAGQAVAAVPRDADGRLRPDPPSMGAWEPYAVAYAPAAEIIRGASKRGVQT